MKDFKVISEAEDSYHIQHKNGKTFTVDKKGLNKKAHEEIKKMCGGGMADGGAPQKLNSYGTVEFNPKDVSNPSNVLYQQPKPAASNAAATSTYGNASNANDPMAWNAAYEKRRDFQNKTDRQMPMADAQQYNKNKALIADQQNAQMQASQNVAGKVEQEAVVAPVEAAQAQVQNLPSESGYAEGGEVDDDGADEEPTEPASAESPAPSSEPAATSVASTPSSAPEAQSYGQALDQQIQNTGSLLKTQQEAAANRNKIQSDLIQQLSPTGQSLQERTAGEVMQLTPDEIAKRTPAQIQADGAATDAKFMEQLQNQARDFNPNRYWGEMSTGKKILATLALAIGGAGVGRNGTSLASEHLNQAINNDVEKQKNDYSNTMNLYKMNHQATQDQLSASFKTKNQLISVAQMQLAQQAGNVKDAEGQLNIQNALSALQQQKNRNNMIQGILANRTPGSGGALPVDAHTVIRQTISDPKQQEAALSALDKNEGLEQARQFINKNFNDIASLGAAAKLSPHQREGAIKSSALVLATKAHIKPAAAEELLNGVFPGGGLTGMEGEKTVSDNRQRLNTALDGMKTPMGFFKPEDFPSTSSNPMAHMTPRELKLQQIVNANPNHAESIKFKNNMIKKYGKDY